MKPLAAGDRLCTKPLMLKGQDLHRLYPGTGYRVFNAKAPLLQLSLPGRAVKSLMGCERCSGDSLQSTTGGSALVMEGCMVDYLIIRLPFEHGPLLQDAGCFPCICLDCTCSFPCAWILLTSMSQLQGMSRGEAGVC